MDYKEEISLVLSYVMDYYYASDGGLEETRDEIINLVLDEVDAGLNRLNAGALNPDWCEGHDVGVSEAKEVVNNLRET